MSVRRPGGRHSNGRQRPGPVPAAGRFYLDPYFACLVFAAVGIGSWALPTSLRLVLLWAVLLLLWLVYREGTAVQVRYSFADLGRGAGIGLAIGIPLLILAFRPLTMAVPILYVGNTHVLTAVAALPASVSAFGLVGATAFASLVVLAPIAEELFFRDVLHRERGFWIGTGMYALAGLILFLPSAGQFWAVLLAVSGVTALLGALYGFLFERYGLTMALACHVAVNLVLLFVPAAMFTAL